MYCVRKVTEDLYWVGGNDRRLALFENIHPIPEGTSYNAYVLLDEKNVLVDTADWEVTRQFRENVEHVLGGRKLDYIIINHMEPDHSASLALMREKYPDAVVITTAKAVTMMKQYGLTDENVQVVKEGDTISFGKHEFTFYTAPMVHWPEVMVSYDKTDKVLFSADAFGSFGSLDGRLFSDEVDYQRDWAEPARRYYTNIVGKYGMQVQKLLQKAYTLDIEYICPLHGLVFRAAKDIAYMVEKYDKWSKYEPEEKGVLICYASMYGNTEEAAYLLASRLCEKGMTNVELRDVSNTHVSYLISSAFKLSNLALLSVTYNNNLFPVMAGFVDDMARLGLKNRKVAVVENGTWAPQAGSILVKDLEAMGMEILGEKTTMMSSLNADTAEAVEKLADEIVASMR